MMVKQWIAGTNCGYWDKKIIKDNTQVWKFSIYKSLSNICCSNSRLYWRKPTNYCKRANSSILSDVINVDDIFTYIAFQIKHYHTWVLYTCMYLFFISIPTISTCSSYLLVDHHCGIDLWLKRKNRPIFLFLCHSDFATPAYRSCHLFPLGTQYYFRNG